MADIDPKKISRAQLLHVARLARLELRDDELGRLEPQLNDILDAVSKVSELDLSDVPPTFAETGRSLAQFFGVAMGAR